MRLSGDVAQTGHVSRARGRGGVLAPPVRSTRTRAQTLERACARTCARVRPFARVQGPLRSFKPATGHHAHPFQATNDPGGAKRGRADREASSISVTLAAFPSSDAHRPHHARVRANATVSLAHAHACILLERERDSRALRAACGLAPSLRACLCSSARTALPGKRLVRMLMQLRRDSCSSTAPRAPVNP